MALNREDTLKKAEKLLRQGRIDQAIAEYERVVESHPRDWATTNSLGDLYVRAGRPAEAATHYARIAKHFADDGFFPKAAALYKKILKITPDDEDVQLEWAEVAVRQKLFADAKAQLTAVAERRRARRDNFGADQIVIRIGSLDPSDFEARRVAAKVVEENGDAAGAADRHREMAADLDERGREEDALAALREAVRLDPADTASRARLARTALAAGRIDEARTYLTREVAGDDPALLMPLAEMALRAGDVDEGLGIVRELLERDPELRESLVNLGLGLAIAHQGTAFACIDHIVKQLVAASEWEDASRILQEFVMRAPRHTPALLSLVEICVDGGLESTMYQAQAQLADAYLTANMATEACVIAEDLVAREPWEPAHIERFRRALVMQGTPNPDAVIADRLSGQSPFMATDPFAEPAPPEPEPAPDEPEPAATGPSPGAPEAPESPALRRPAAPPTPRDPAFRVTLGGIDMQAILGEPSTSSETEPAVRPTAEVVPPEPAAPAAAEPPKAAQPPVRSLDKVFKTLRRDTARESGAEGGAQQLALADTYIEMGMLDEAIQALEGAVRSPRHRFQAASSLSRLYKRKGDLPQAIEWMERATQAPPPTPEDGHSLLYELGLTLEGLGETARALAVFLELQSDAGDYRDVTARVERLARVQTGG